MRPTDTMNPPPMTSLLSNRAISSCETRGRPLYLFRKVSPGSGERQGIYIIKSGHFHWKSSCCLLQQVKRKMQVNAKSSMGSSVHMSHCQHRVFSVFFRTPVMTCFCWAPNQRNASVVYDISSERAITLSWKKPESCSRSEHITAIDYIVQHTFAWIMKPTLDDTLTHLSYLSYRTPATTTSQNPSYRVLYCGKYLRTEQSDRKSTLAIPVFISSPPHPTSLYRWTVWWDIQ